MTGIKTLVRTFLLTMQAVPLNSIVAMILSLSMTIYYMLSVGVTEKLFESINFYSEAGQNHEEIILYVVIFVGMRLLQSVIIFLNGFNGNVFVFRKATNYYRKKLSDKASQLPLIQYEDDQINDMYSRAQTVINDERISEAYMSLLNVAQNILTIIGVSVILCSYSTWLLIIAILSVMPVFIVRIIRGKDLYKIKFHQAKSSRHMNYYWELLFNKDGMKEITVFNFFHYIKQKWRKYCDDVDQQNWEFIRDDSKSVLFANLISTAGYVLSIVISIALLLDGHINIAVFGACLSAFSSMQSATKNFVFNLSDISEHVLFCKDYFDFIDIQIPQDGKIIIKAVPDVIKVNHVFFRYPNCEEDVLKDVCLEIKKGEKVAFVGENGCGKTTLVKLILGLYEPSKGEIYYDGIPHNKIEKESLYKMISYMMQMPLKYQTTLQESVALSNVETQEDKNKVRSALEWADMGYFLDDNNLEVRLGNEFDGLELSGGEWQKIALARVLYRNSNFVVLDEPTSSIDPIIEMKILKTVLENTKKKTAIIVCHRMGVCGLVDKIVMLHKGEVSEIGSHTNLMQRKGKYHELFTAQAQWYQTW